MNLQEHIRKVLREENLNQFLINHIKDNGILDTSRLVGGG
jgi:hypothetical protein